MEIHEFSLSSIKFDQSSQKLRPPGLRHAQPTGARLRRGLRSTSRERAERIAGGRRGLVARGLTQIGFSSEIAKLL